MSKNTFERIGEAAARLVGKFGEQAGREKIAAAIGNQKERLTACQQLSALEEALGERIKVESEGPADTAGSSAVGNSLVEFAKAADVLGIPNIGDLSEAELQASVSEKAFQAFVINPMPKAAHTTPAQPKIPQAQAAKVKAPKPQAAKTMPAKSLKSLAKTKVAEFRAQLPK